MHFTVAEYQLVIQTVGATLGGLFAVFSGVKGWPLVRRLSAGFMGRTRLAAERDAAIAQTRQVTAALSTFQISDQGWRSAVDALEHRLEALDGDVQDFRSKFNSAVRYICQLIVHIEAKANVPMPPVPDDLRDIIDGELRKAN